MTKAWWQSKTIWGGLIAVLASSASIGIDIDLKTGAITGNIYDLFDHADALLSAIGGAGGLLAVIGRLKADTPVRPVRSKKGAK